MGNTYCGRPAYVLPRSVHTSPPLPPPTCYTDEDYVIVGVGRPMAGLGRQIKLWRWLRVSLATTGRPLVPQISHDKGTFSSGGHIITSVVGLFRSSWHGLVGWSWLNVFQESLYYIMSYWLHWMSLN